MRNSDLILRTKLQPPKPRGKILRRERLINALKNNLDKKLILICADAGYGKTTLLAQLCNELTKPFLFYDLASSDNYLMVFFNHIAAGMAQAFTRFGKRTKEIINQTRNIEIIVGTFINEFSETVKSDFYLIVDDYHYLQQNREISQALDYLLRHSPQNFHLIIASRRTPNLDWNYYLAKQNLFKIEKEDLQFNLNELQGLLRDVYCLKIPDEDVRRLEQHSEGWITAIQLILQKIFAAGSEKIGDTLNSYITSGEDIFNYFAREVFESQPREIREFFMHTAILDYLNPEVCNYLLNTRKSEKLLRYFESEHLFVSRIGDKYKYHPIFHDFLIQRLNYHYPSQRIKQLYQKLGNYFLSKGGLFAAVSNFLKAENYERAAMVLEKSFAQCRFWGEYNYFNTLVDRFPETIIERFPTLLLRKAMFLLQTSRNDIALRILASVIPALRKAKKHNALADAYFAMGSLFLQSVEPEKAQRYFQRAELLAAKKDKRRRIDILLGYCNANRLLGKYQKCEYFLKEATGTVKRIDDMHLEIEVLRTLASFYWAKFNYKKAEETYNEIIERFEPDDVHFELGEVYVDAALVAIYNYHLESAARNLTRARQFIEKYNDARLKFYQIFAQGDYYYARRDYYKALENYNTAVELGTKSRSKLSYVWVVISKALAYMKLGKINDCLETLKTAEALNVDKTHPPTHIALDTLRGQIALAQGDVRRSTRFLKRALTDSLKHQQPYQAMTSYYEMTRVFLVKNDLRKALGLLTEAVRIAKVNSYDAYLIYEGYSDIGPLRFGLQSNLLPVYLASVLRRVDTDEAKNLLAAIDIKKGIYDIECHLLGNLEISSGQNGNVITPRWRTKRAKSLFIYLITNCARGCTRDRLIETFWPNKNLVEATHSLHVEISYLRNIVRKMIRTDLELKRIIAFENQKYFFNPRIIVKTDIQEFEELAKGALAHGLADRAKVTQLCQKALALYRGDFCADVKEEWCDDGRMYYKDCALRILKRLGEVYYEEGSYQKSLNAYETASQFSDYDEAIHLGMMRNYAALGDKNGVQNQYRRLLETLRKLDIETPPSEATKIFEESGK